VLTLDLQILGQRHKDLKNGLSAPPPIGDPPIHLADGDQAALGAGHARHQAATFGNIVGHAKGVGRHVLAVSWTASSSTRRWTGTTWLDQGALGRQADPEGHSRPRGCDRWRPESGADAIIVSNHGGRQLDGARPRSPCCRDRRRGRRQDRGAHGRRHPLRPGRAQGARARRRGTYIGRAFLYGLGAMGEGRRHQALEIIRKELDITMALLRMGYLCFCFEVAPDKVGDVEMERVVQNVFPLLKQTRLVAVTLDLQGRVQFANDALRHLLQCSAAELIGCRLFETRLATGARSLLEQLYPGGTQSANFPAEFQSELLRHDQQSRHVAWHAVVWRDAAGRAMGSILIGNDVTELLREEKKTSLYISAFEATAHAIVVTDTQGSIISVNRAFTQLTGYSRDEALGQNPRILQSGKHEPAFYEQMWKTITASGHWHGDVWDRRKDGSIYPKYLSISAIKNSSGALTNYVGIFFDNSERHTLEERLDQLAHYDALTGLPNRSLLLDRLEQAVERAIRLGTKVGLIYLDLDHFKHVNDSFGHSAGDQLLKAVAKRAKTCVRAVDTVARLGGDEFVILVPDAMGQDDISTLASKLLAALTPPYDIEGRSATSTPSIGISIYPDDGANVDDLMKLADTAMYQAKQSGRANFKFFNDTSCHIKGNDDLFTKDVSPA
jgi:diguanylate cyclase (GGDEF)-like protein/PAS domain S-box-containing protein